MSDPRAQLISPSKPPERSKLSANLLIIIIVQLQAFQKVWKSLFVIVCIIFAYLSYEVYQYRTDEYYTDKYYAPKGSFYNFIFWGLVSSVLYLITDHYWHKKVDSWVENNFITLTRYTDPQSKKKRSYTLAKWGYFVLFYLGSSVSGYLLIKQTSFFPKFLGGHGDVFSLTEQRSLTEASYWMEIYYFVELGKHIGRFFAHIFIRPEGSYYEYCLHHALSVYLIVYSYCINFWYIGIFVLIIHDYTDFGLILARTYKDYRYKNSFVLKIAYVHAVGGWILLRVFLFSYTCVYAPIYQYIDYIQSQRPAYQSKLPLMYAFIIFMLLCLQFMHIYWTYYIINSAVEIGSNQKLKKHNYD